MNYWTQTTCPECEAENWYNHGDLGDLTYVNADGLECRVCSHLFMFAESLDSGLDAEIAFQDFVCLNRPFESDEEAYAFEEDCLVHPNLNVRRQSIYREYGCFPKGELLLKYRQS